MHGLSWWQRSVPVRKGTGLLGFLEGCDGGRFETVEVAVVRGIVQVASERIERTSFKSAASPPDLKEPSGIYMKGGEGRFHLTRFLPLKHASTCRKRGVEYAL